MKKILLLSIALVFSVSCSQNTRKDKGVNEAPSMAPAVTQKMDNSSPMTAPVEGVQAQPSNTPAVKSDTLLPEVAAKYSGVKLEVLNVKTKKSYEVDAAFGKKLDLKDTPFSIVVQSLFPNFKMGETGIINISLSETNPGAKVQIFKGSDIVFDGWLFQKYPDMHGFENPDFSIVMTACLPK